MRIVLAFVTFATLMLAGCGTETNYCVGEAADGSCQYFQAPSACSNPEYCAEAGGYAIHMTQPTSCKKIEPIIPCQ